ncbi:MAG: Tim44 domain-containing protein [Oligoflexus sp.]
MLVRLHPANFVRCFLLILFSAFIFESYAEARAGRGRSMGRQQQSRSRQQEARPQTPPQQNQNARPQGGGFMRGLAGGLAGGFLGSMLFSSLGHGMNGGALGGGGIGLLEIILFAAIAYFAFRWWKNRQAQTAAATGQQFAYQAAPAAAMEPAGLGDRQTFLSPSTPFPGESSMAQLDEDQASDIFFRVQAAWMRRDITTVRDLLSPEMSLNLQRDMDELIAQKRSNRLENISVRRVEIGESWQENGTNLVAVRFVANLLDYVVDDVSGQIIEGDDRLPVKFEETWILSQTPGEAGWRLAGIEQR